MNLQDFFNTFTGGGNNPSPGYQPSVAYAPPHPGYQRPPSWGPNPGNNNLYSGGAYTEQMNVDQGGGNYSHNPQVPAYLQNYQSGPSKGQPMQNMPGGPPNPMMWNPQYNNSAGTSSEDRIHAIMGQRPMQLANQMNYDAKYPHGDGSQSQAAPYVDPNASMIAQMQAQALQATQYQQAQMDLANRRFSWEQSQAAATAEAAKQQRESGAADAHNNMVLNYMGAHPTTGASVAAGYFAPSGEAGSRAMAPNADLMQYYKDHPEAGPAPGTGGDIPVGYTGAQSVGAGDGATHATIQNSTLQAAHPGIGGLTAGNTGINLPDFMYGNRTAAGTPVPLGPQQEAAMGANVNNKNAFQDYAGNYAGFDPTTLLGGGGSLGQGQSGGGSNLKMPTTYPGQGF